MIYVLVFVFGTIVGSFLNVVILRYGTGQSFVKGNSRCFSCNKNLSWYELAPIFSFLIQKGKCRGCGSRISIQYPIVEFLTGILFLLTTWKLNFQVEAEALFIWLIISLLIVIAVYDLRHKIIPNLFVWLFNGLAFLFIFFENWNFEFVSDFGFRLPAEALAQAGISDFWPSFLAGLSFASFFALLWLVSKGRWMGFGDAKLALGLGWFLGSANTFLAFLFSFWLGGIVGIFLLLRKKADRKTQIPFAPFLIAGALIAFLLSIDISKFISF